MEFANIVSTEDIHMMVRSEEFYAFLLQKRKRVNILENKRKNPLHKLKNFLNNSLIEIYLTCHTIDPFKVNSGYEGEDGSGFGVP